MSENNKNQQYKPLEDVAKGEDKELGDLIDKQILRFSRDIGKHLSESLEPELLLLKGHLLIEYYLGLLLILNDEKKEILEETFYKKIQRSKELNIVGDPYMESIFCLNRLRNRMAHELEYTISESDVDSISMPFGKEYILKKMDAIEENHSNSIKKLLRWFFEKNLRKILISTIIKIDKEKKAFKKE